MPAPLVAWVIFEIVMIGLAAYEGYSVLSDLYEGFDQYSKGVEKAKQEIKETIQKLKDEIDQKIEEKQEVPILLTLAGADPQGPVTRKPSGRGAGNATINAAIEQKIPFRQVISKVCEQADAMPVLNLRRKQGVKISDLPKAKRKALEALLEKGFEQITEKDLGDFIAVRLKQLAASLMFEFIDNTLDWASPLKTEVSFGPPPRFDDPPSEGTKLTRKGTINPFYPAPHRSAGSISADLIIPDYRKKPCRKDNIFAIVEVKFPGDRIAQEQFEKYERLLAVAAPAKTKASPVRFGQQPVSSGGRLSLFRFPEDKAHANDDGKRDDSKSRGTRRRGN
jgi:hypothetical protein